MNLSSELMQAKAEIKAIMDKYDIGGFVSLHNRTHTEFELFLPEWSVIKMQKGEGGINVSMRCQEKKDTAIKKITESFHVLMDCKLACDNTSRLLGDAINGLTESGLKDQFEITNTPFHERGADTL